jgi:hypothetical protein
LRSSAWFGVIRRLVYFIIDLNRSGAGPGALSEAQRRAFGGNGFLFLFPPNTKISGGSRAKRGLRPLD